MISTLDLPATTLALAGAEIPVEMQGRAFTSASFQRKFVVSALDRNGGAHHRSRSIRSSTARLTIHWKRLSPVEAATSYRRETHPLVHLVSVMQQINILPAECKQLVEPPPKIELFLHPSDSHEMENGAFNPARQNLQEELKAELIGWLATHAPNHLSEDRPEVTQAFDHYRRASKAKRSQKIDQLRTNVRRQILE